MKTLGLSPKTLRPLLLGIIAAAALAALDMRDEAKAVLAAVLAGGGLSWLAPPGVVVTDDPDGDYDDDELAAYIAEDDGADA